MIGRVERFCVGRSRAVVSGRQHPWKTRHLTTNHRGPGIYPEASRAEQLAEPQADLSKENHDAQYTPSHNTVKPAFKSSTSPLVLHNSLDSFLHYAAQTNLSITSTVYRGTKYEYICLNTLTRLGFNLQRVGGAHDAGIDLEGTWHLPTLAAPLQAVVQCKFLTKKGISPVLVRELEGTFTGRSTGSERVTVRVLCTPSLATKAVREVVGKCSDPIMLVVIDNEGWLDAISWNGALQEICEDARVGLRYVNGRKEAVILVGDQIWESDGGADSGNRNE